MGRATQLYYQYYAAIHYGTCERCLNRHGEIFTDPASAPPIHQGCRCSYLEIPPDERDYYGEMAKRMRAKAESELRRRELFHQGKDLLGDDPKKALVSFRQAAEIEVYLDEVEGLCQADRPNLTAHPDLTKKLRDLLVYGYQNKFTKKKYEHITEGMKWAREKWGVRRIEELFDDLLAL